MYRLENLCPNACENFLRLCEGYRQESGKVLKYQNCPVHRLVTDGWFQTGDVIDGSGKNSAAVIDPSGQFPDESYSADFGFPRGGMFGYANEGAHTNRSQFFVTLGNSSWMNNKFVGFARVIQGFKVLKKINNIPTSNQCPTRVVRIGTCGRPAELLPPATVGGSS
ncbi:peptidylprolyl isomerase [archaeon]|nr:MAG: peptidylprolyl isomerase [archaeon]